jgi:hypothetical protein
VYIEEAYNMLEQAGLNWFFWDHLIW